MMFALLLLSLIAPVILFIKFKRSNRRLFYGTVISSVVVLGALPDLFILFTEADYGNIVIFFHLILLLIMTAVLCLAYERLQDKALAAVNGSELRPLGTYEITTKIYITYMSIYTGIIIWETLGTPLNADWSSRTILTMLSCLLYAAFVYYLIHRRYRHFLIFFIVLSIAMAVIFPLSLLILVGIFLG